MRSLRSLQAVDVLAFVWGGAHKHNIYTHVHTHFAEGYIEIYKNLSMVIDLWKEEAEQQS